VRRLLWLVKDHRRRHPGFAGLARMTGRMASAARRGGVPGVMQAIRNYSHFRSALMQVPAPQMAGQQVAVDVLLPDAGPAILPAGGLAVHVHAYYVDLLPELCGYLSNLPGPFQLFVTTDTEAKAHEILGIVAGRGWQAHADVRVVENRGRDTAPMLVSLGPELSRFGVVLHVHTKKSPHNHELRGWRSFLLTALLGSKEGVSAILRRFAQDEDLGLLFPAPYLPVQPFMHMGGNREFAAKLLGVCAGCDR
jgi:lipopolysaccharide biosynthesis protein